MSVAKTSFMTICRNSLACCSFHFSVKLRLGLRSRRSPSLRLWFSATAWSLKSTASSCPCVCVCHAQSIAASGTMHGDAGLHCRDMQANAVRVHRKPALTERCCSLADVDSHCEATKGQGLLMAEQWRDANQGGCMPLEGDSLDDG